MCGSSRLSKPESAQRKNKKKKKDKLRLSTLVCNPQKHCLYMKSDAQKADGHTHIHLGFITHRFLVPVSNSELLLQRGCHPSAVKLPLLPVRRSNKSLLTHNNHVCFNFTLS